MIQRAILGRNPPDPMAYVKQIARPIALNQLERDINRCNNCTLCKDFIIQLHRNTDAPILVLTESVDEMQSTQKVVRPFEGALGSEAFTTVIDHYRVPRDLFYFANVVNGYPCKDVDGNRIGRVPKTNEIEACKPFVEKLIALIEPKMILLLGSSALNAFKKEAITKFRGTLFTINGIPSIATYHPAYFKHIEGRKSKSEIDDLKNDFIADLYQSFEYFEEHYYPIMKGE